MGLTEETSLNGLALEPNIDSMESGFDLTFFFYTFRLVFQICNHRATASMHNAYENEHCETD